MLIFLFYFCIKLSNELMIMSFCYTKYFIIDKFIIPHIPHAFLAYTHEKYLNNHKIFFSK